MRRWVRQMVVAAVLLGWTGTLAASPEGEARPPRAPRPWVGAEPWAGFRLADHGVVFAPPLAAAANDARWTGWLAASASSPRPEPAPAEPAAAETAAVPVAAPARESFLERESPAFRDAWSRARSAAEQSDAAALAAALDALDPRTAEGSAGKRALAFALAVAQGDRAAADSLFYRISWRDGGRTATRLSAWRALERGEGSRAAAALEGLPDRTPGEAAALALARWMAEPGRADPQLPAGSFPPAAARAVALAQARHAIVSGDLAEARRALSALEDPEFPPAWSSVRAELSRLAEEEGPGGEDARDYGEAVRVFLEGADAEAATRLDRWLAAWPESPYRPQAYYLRGVLELAAGRLDEAARDLEVAESRGAGEISARAALARAFRLARSGDAAGARARFDRVFAGPLGATAEAELLANRIRLARLLEDEDGARDTELRLEEGFPDSPWLARARGDVDASRWGEPWRVRPPEPARTDGVPDAPREGPWGPLLFGEDFPARTAADLDHAANVDRAAAMDRGPAASDRLPPARPESTAGRRLPLPVIFVGVGGGAPAAFLSEAAVGRAAGPVRYRAGFGRMLAGERNGLPESHRFHGEGGLGIRPGRWRLELTARADGINDDGSSALGLPEGEVDADWRGLRLDAGFRAEEGSRASIFASRSRGEVDAGQDRATRTDQSWFGGDLEWRRDEILWRGRFAAAVMDQRMPGFEDFRFWFRDLRVARAAPGGWYVGARAALYHRRGLLMPVAGAERGLGAGWTGWVASEPTLGLPPFRETFVVNGYRQTPDLTLPAERRDLDLRGGVRWRTAGAEAEARAELFRVGHLRTWTRDEGLWRETAVDEATGSRLAVSGSAAPGGFRLAFEIAAQRIAADGRRVPYTPRVITSLELEYRMRGWRWGVSAEGVDGRRGEDGAAYGSYLRWNLETAYRWRAGNLPLGARWLELWVRAENLGDADDARWPGIPGAGAGVYGGVQALYGD